MGGSGRVFWRRFLFSILFLFLTEIGAITGPPPPPSATAESVSSSASGSDPILAFSEKNHPPIAASGAQNIEIAEDPQKEEAEAANAETSPAEENNNSNNNPSTNPSASSAEFSDFLFSEQRRQRLAISFLRFGMAPNAEGKDFFGVNDLPFKSFEVEGNREE